jgi:hypothetical protein
VVLVVRLFNVLLFNVVSLRSKVEEIVNPIIFSACCGMFAPYL